MEYTIEDHKHRFACWAASRASSVIGVRFSVEQGKALIEAAKLDKYIENPAKLPNSSTIDEAHKEWRSKIIEYGNEINLDISHGVAAKLINMYFKTIFVCGGYHEHENVKSLHPPVDSVLLDALIKNNVGNLTSEWKMFSRIRWSKLDSDEYEEIVANIRATVPVNEGLWKIENYWRGYQ